MARSVPARRRSIFSPATSRERAENFSSYWTYLRRRDGELLEAERTLAGKQRILARYQDRAVRSRRPLAAPDRFYRNHVTMRDDPQTLDRTTLLLTFLYKFARQEWAGISAAWEATPTLAESMDLTDRISRYHLAEEFCHVRLFHEMFRTFHLDQVHWVPLPRWVSQTYAALTRIPAPLAAPAAVVTELMGLMVYLHLDRILDATLAGEPEARERIRALLHEIAVDELGHVGLRRNYMGPVGRRVAKRIVQPMFRGFFRGIPEATLLFDLRRMAKDAEQFDYSTVPPELLEASWVPSYCWSIPDRRA